MKKIFKMLWKTVGKAIVKEIINEIFDEYRQKRLIETGNLNSLRVERDVIEMIQKSIIDGIENKG